jgi:S-formylglutathione hydrolase FrmB
MLLRKPPTAAEGASAWHLRAFRAAFGDPIDSALWTASDPLELAQRADKERTPALHFDCGAQDRYGLVAGHAELHRRLDARGVSHEYALAPGDHGYEYVREALPASLRFLGRHLAG